MRSNPGDFLEEEKLSQMFKGRAQGRGMQTKQKHITGKIIKLTTTEGSRFGRDVMTEAGKIFPSIRDDVKEDK